MTRLVLIATALVILCLSDSTTSSSFCRLEQPDKGRLHCSVDAALNLNIIPLNTKQLEISLNFKNFLNDSAMPYMGAIEYLSLRNATEVKEIGHKNKYPNLKTLDLRYNSLRNMPNISVTGLRTLLLSENSLEEVDANFFASCDKIKELFLDKNLITALRTTSFAIKVCDDSAVCHMQQVLTSLIKLVVNSNTIRKLDPGSFSNLKHLRALNLANNRISDIKHSTFEGLTLLEHLDLSHNKILTVEDGSFAHLTELNYLNLQHNRLTTVSRGLPMLQWLDISHNHMTTISEDHKSEFYAIEYITMAHNPFHCDCKLLWLKEYYDGREYQKKFEESDDFVPVCSTPSHLHGESWEFIDDSLFTCDVMTSSKLDTNNPDDNSFDPGLLTVKAGVVSDNAISVEWSVSGTPPSATVIIQYYLFGRRQTSLKFVEIAMLQRRFGLKPLEPVSNYVICVIPRLSSDTDAAVMTPLAYHHCIEVTTAAASTSRPTSFVWLFVLYLSCMVATLLLMFIVISFIAFCVGNLWPNSDSATISHADIDEPISADATGAPCSEPISADVTGAPCSEPISADVTGAPCSEPVGADVTGTPCSVEANTNLSDSKSTDGGCLRNRRPVKA